MEYKIQGAGLKAGTYTIQYQWADAVQTNPAYNGTVKITIGTDGDTVRRTTTITGPTTTGTYYLYVKGVDLIDTAGNKVSPTANRTFKVDRTAPEITIDISKSEEWKASYQPTIKVNDSAKGGSAIDTTSLKYSWIKGTNTTAAYGTTYQSGTKLAVYGAVNGKDVASGNDWYITAQAKDASGNLATAKFGPYWIDNELPTTDAPAVTTTTNSATVTANQKDTKAGINATTYQFSYREAGGEWNPWVDVKKSSHTFTGLTLNKNYEFRTQVKDTLNNGYSISAGKPATTANIGKPSINSENTSWTSGNVWVKIDYTDKDAAHSTLTWQYKVGTNGAWQTTNSNPQRVEVTTAGTTVYAQQYDSTNQGKEGTGTSTVVSLKIDNIDKSSPGKTTYSGGHSGAWTTYDYSVTLSCTDVGSGIAKYQYSTSTNGPWTDCTSSVSYVGDVNYTHYYRAVDGVGNVGEVSIANTIKIDKTVPTQPSLSGQHHAAWVNYDYNVTLASSDNISGISTYQYSFDNSSWANCGSTYACSGDQNRWIYFRAVNGAGLTSDSNLFQCAIDKTGPTIAYVNGTFNTWSTNSQISIGANGDASGISAYQYYDSRLAQWLGCDQNPNRGEGQYDMYFRAVDGAGNIGPQVGPYHCYFDWTGPTMTAVNGSFNAWVKGNTISLGASDNVSGVAGYHYYDSRSGVWTGSPNPLGCGEGAYSLYFRAYDNAGNVGPQVGPYNVYVDWTPPYIASLERW